MCFPGALPVILEPIRVPQREDQVGELAPLYFGDKHDVVKLAPERPAQLVEKILCLTGVGGPHDQGVEGQLSGVHGFVVAVAVYY